MTKIKKIAILGCGWVGRALEEKLLLDGHSVQCLSRDIRVDRQSGYYVCDVLVIAIPPSDIYLDVLEEVFFSLSLHTNKSTQIIFLSSISFYTKKKYIVEAEALVKLKDPDTVILRLGGLMGYDRIADKYTVGKTLDDSPTNYVHRDDVLGIIMCVIRQGTKNKTFDVVAPIQTTKKVIFAQNTQQYDFAMTYFSDKSSTSKPYSSQELRDTLGYTFIKKDVKNFWL